MWMQFTPRTGKGSHFVPTLYVRLLEHSPPGYWGSSSLTACWGTREVHFPQLWATLQPGLIAPNHYWVRSSTFPRRGVRAQDSFHFHEGLNQPVTTNLYKAKPLQYTHQQELPTALPLRPSLEVADHSDTQRHLNPGIHHLTNQLTHLTCRTAPENCQPKSSSSLFGALKKI